MAADPPSGPGSGSAPARLGRYQEVGELGRGESLRNRIRIRPMAWDEALEKAARPLLGAQDALHRAGVTHRDVKPENLLADTAGIFHLADLGLATFSGREARTATGIVYGTPGYLAPETIDSAQLDGYSAALTLVEAVAGRLPWGATGPASINEQLRWAPGAADLQALGVPGAIRPAPGALAHP